MHKLCLHKIGPNKSDQAIGSELQNDEKKSSFLALKLFCFFNDDKNSENGKNNGKFHKWSVGDKKPDKGENVILYTIFFGCDVLNFKGFHLYIVFLTLTIIKNLFMYRM